MSGLGQPTGVRGVYSVSTTFHWSTTYHVTSFNFAVLQCLLVYYEWAASLEGKKNNSKAEGATAGVLSLPKHLEDTYSLPRHRQREPEAYVLTVGTFKQREP